MCTSQRDPGNIRALAWNWNEVHKNVLVHIGICYRLQDTTSGGSSIVICYKNTIPAGSSTYYVAKSEYEKQDPSDEPQWNIIFYVKDRCEWFSIKKKNKIK